MAIKTAFKDAVETKVSPNNDQVGDFNGAANPTDGGSDLPFSPNQYATLHPAPSVPYTPVGKPVFKISKG